MRSMCEAKRTAKALAARPRILVPMVMLCLCSGTATAQIDVNETDLHDGQPVYGFYAPGTPIPYANLEAITLWAWGSDDPNYTDVSFYAYGLYADNGLVNGGVIDVNAIGGTATALGGIADANAYAYGLFSDAGDVNNISAITIVATGGTAEADTPATADANAVAIYSGSTVTNRGDLTATAIGGTATADGDDDGIVYDATAHTYAYGILATDDVNNAGVITATATSGSADANWADADAYAYGLFTQGDVNNTGALTATAHSVTIPTMTSSIRSAYAYGIDANGLVTNIADVNSVAVGGSATAIAIRGSAGVDNQGDLITTAAASLHSAMSYGITSLGDVNNRGDITATGTAGTASETANDQVYSETVGIYATGNVTNAGNLSLAAEGGTIGASDDDLAYAYAFASARGIDAHGDAVNTGVINVAATGGTATANSTIEELAYAFAEAIGINTEQSGSYEGDVHNTGDLTVTAAGGTADSYHAGSTDLSVETSTAAASATGIRSGGDANNAGVLTITAIGGLVSANESASATARADGVSASGLLQNSGVIDVNAVGGTASVATGNADTGADAYGLESDSNDVSNTGVVTVAATGGTATAETGATHAEAEVYGISGQGAVANTGAITVTGTAGTATTDSSLPSGADAHVNVYGVSAGGDVANSGNLAVAATAGTAHSSYSSEAYAVGHGILSGGQVANTGNITTTATAGTADANDGYNADASVRANGIFTATGNVGNTGNLAVIAAAGTADRAEEAAADVTVYGIFSGADVNNAGAVTLTATAGTANALDDTDTTVEARGIHAVGQVNNTGALAVTVHGGTATFGLNGTSDADISGYGIVTGGDIHNTSNVTVTAIGGTSSGQGEVDADVNAWGLYSHTGGAVTNTGDIAVTVGGPTVDNGDAPTGMGVYAVAIHSGTIDNTGTVEVTATGGHMTGGDSEAFADVTAFGLRSDTVNNRGAITVTAAGTTAGGLDAVDELVFACGISAGSVSNAADVNAVATSDADAETYALGIQLYGDGTLTNTGILRAFADTAYELQVGFGTTTLVDSYNVTLDGDPDDASIYIADRATLALNDATLTVTEVSGETLWDTPYRLFEADPNGAVTGQFGSVEAVNPDATAVYYTQGTAGAVDDTVALTYSPGTSEATGSSTVTKQVVYQAGDIINRRMTGALLQNILSPISSPLLASAGSTTESMALANSAAKTSSGVYFEPYYSRLDQDADPLGFRARLWGFAAGYQQHIENTLLGFHAGYGRSDIDYTGTGYSANREDQDVLTAGVSGLTRWDPWTLRYGLTGFYGWHDYTGLTGLSLDERETASYNSYGAAAQMMAGRAFRQNQHVFLPEVGLSYLWTHRNRYTTEATNPSWNTTYGSLDDHDLQAEAALGWLGDFMHETVRIVPSASIGVRHLLTDDETGVWMSVPGAAPVLVRSDRDRTALVLSGSVTLARARQALSLAYDGEYANDSRRHSVWLRLSWSF